HELYTCQIPSRLESREEVIQAVLDAAAERGFQVDPHFDRLCLDEALINAITHGNANDPSKRVTVRVFCSQAAWGVEVADEGAGFDWRGWLDYVRDGLDVSRTSGRGLAIILGAATKVQFLDEGRRLRMIWQHDSS
ncbi:hypothetical protein BV582_22780, partial [Bacillus paralicheniformis]